MSINILRHSGFKRWFLSIFLIIALLVSSIPAFAANPEQDQALDKGRGKEIKLQYATFDPTVSQPSIPSTQAAGPADKSKHYIVQFDGPIQQEWKDQISALGGKILSYVPDFAFVVKMEPQVKAQVDKLESIRWVGPFHPAYKIAPGLAKKSGEVEVTVVVWEGEDIAGPKNAVKSFGGEVKKEAKRVMRAKMKASDLARLVQDDAVAWVEEFVAPKLVNDVARKSVANTATAWEDLGLYGAGQIVAVCDTGLDTGSTATLNADLQGRVIDAFAWGRVNDWSDPHGHGTHVAGSVAGNGTNSGGNAAAHSYTDSYAGMAPEAQIVFQSVLDSGGGLGGLPLYLTDIFDEAYNAGARIHTNSWGASKYGAYDWYSLDVDQFIWEHPDMTILFAASNDGTDANSDGIVDRDSLGAPATAKNCIAVGASENLRPPADPPTNYTWGWAWPYDFPKDPIASDYLSDNINGMAAFSSRGPTDDGRIKPDMVAPGTNIISVRSSLANPNDNWGYVNDNYVYMGGTSMATPLTAGAAALVREYYTDIAGVANPSAALIKATLLNGAKDMNPGQYGTGAKKEMKKVPNVVEGWGRLDLKGSLQPGGSIGTWFKDEKTGLTTNQSSQQVIPVTSSSDPLNITLVWSDYPSDPFAYYNLVNDLDLKVTAPDGTVYWGNGANGGNGYIPGDGVNNVEGVRIANPVTGNWKVQIKAYNVPVGPQPYALVVSGGFNTSDPAGSLSIDNGAQFAKTTAVTLNASYTNAKQMAFSNDAANWSDWMPVKAAKPWTLPSGEGVKVVYAKFKSAWGAESPIVSDDIFLDTNKPTGSIQVAGGAETTKASEVSVLVDATDSSGLPVAEFRLGEPKADGTVAWQTAWMSYPVTGTITTDFVLSTGPDGPRKVVAKVKDQAGRISAKITDTINLNTAPTDVEVAPYSLTPAVTWVAPNPDVVKYKVIIQKPDKTQMVFPTGSSDPQFMIPAGKLKEGKTYKARVKAYVYGRWSSGSEWVTFTASDR